MFLRFVQDELGENETQYMPQNLMVSVNDQNCELPTMNIPTEFGKTWQCNVPINITAQLA